MWLPLGLGAQALTQNEQLEVNMAQQQLSNWNTTPGLTGWNPDIGLDDVMEDFTPTAGATETFTPAVGDHFYDPGGAGGSPYPDYDGPNDYPNCGCVTNTTLEGVTELKFNDFSVFATFDWLKIYDGTDNTGVKLYDNSATGANSGDILLSDMIASHGSDTFTSTSGNFFFEFNASTVVGYAGWDVEILEADNGGGGTTDCSGPGSIIHDDGSIENGTSGSPILVSEVVFVDKFTPTSYPATIESVCSAFIMLAGGTPNHTYDIVVYDDDGTGGAPGTLIGELNGLTAVDVPVFSAGMAPVWQSENTASQNWVIEEGNVYIGVRFAPTDPNHFIATDETTSTPSAGGYWWNDFDNVWSTIGTAFPGYRSLFVRSEFSGDGDPGEGCEWTVTVYGSGLADEVSWEFRDSGGAVLLSGGPYSDIPYMDVQTVTAEDPVEFYIESMGDWGDNTPAFTIANENGIILNSSIMGGTEETFSGLLCSDLPPPAPDNDNCGDVTPTTLTNGTPATFTGTTEGATGSAEELTILGFPAVWEAVTLTGDCNNLTVDYCGTTPGVMDGQIFVVYTQSCPVTDFVIGTYDFTTCGDGNGTVRFYNLPAGTYYLPVIVDPTFNTLGEYTMNVLSEDCPPPPTNDDCEDATPLSCGDSDSGSTLSANDSGGNPSGDVFYSFTGDGSEQMVTVSLCGSFYDTTLRIFTDCSMTTEVAYNDDSCELQSEVSFLSDGTSTYIIMVEGYNSNTGEYVINLTCEEPPVYDPCAPANSGEPFVGIGFSDGYMAANDFDVLANTQFAVEKITLEVATVAGDPTTFNVSFFEGESGVENPVGSTFEDLVPTSVTPNGYLFGFYPMYTVELTLPTTETFPATTTEDKKYWIAIESALDSTGGFTYWVSTAYMGTTLPTWQNDGVNWFVYDDGAGGNGEGVMAIEGECETLGLSDISTTDFAYYPNPVNNILNIESRKNIESVSIFNMTGQKVISNLKVENGKVNLSSLSPGSYVFRVRLEGGQVETFKVVKK